MCFGVRDAISAAREVTRPEDVSIYGELVHNEELVQELGRRGFHSLPETRRSPDDCRQEVLVTAHGISRKEETRLRSTGRTLIDTTCPLVRAVHRAAMQLQSEEYFVVILGKPGHAEVIGIVDDLECYDVVSSLDDVVCWNRERIGVVCQSTTSPAAAARLERRIRELNPRAKLRFIDTICTPTRDRQEAIDALVGEVEAVIVVGGKHSNNTRELVRKVRRLGRPAFHVQTAADVDPRWFEAFSAVGLTAGTSTPEELIDAVYRRLLGLGSDTGRGAE